MAFKDEEKSAKLVSTQDDREYRDHHIIDVTCKKVGETYFTYTVGSKPTSDVE